MNKRKQIIVSVAAVLLLVLLTIGVTYAVFTYTKLGTTENTVTAGTLKFLYTENTGVGAGIKLENALPVSDSIGKAYSTEGKVFDFSIEATNTGTEVIPYEITLRKKDTSTLGEEAVKVYLTDMTEDADSEILEPTLYSNLAQTNIDVGDEIEKTIHTDSVAGGELTYLKDYRLRMWVAEETDFSTGEYNDKTFIATVNVYSNVPLVSEEEMNLRGNAEVTSISVDSTEMTAVTGQSYQYQTILPEGTTEATINVETENPNSTVTIEKVDSLAYDSNINRMASAKKVSLNSGINYFKVTVTSQNKELTKEYGIRINVIKTVALKDAIFEAYPTIKENATLNNTSAATGQNGLYKSTATNDGSPTYYFRGAITNNYVEFAGQTWRIVRINEDGTIRLVMQNGINNNTGYEFSLNGDGYTNMYYSNSYTKTQLESWYATNIINKGYEDKLVIGDYYCEQAKAKAGTSFTSGNATMAYWYNAYTPNFKCSIDGNGKGIVNSGVGLLTYDELVHAGGYPGTTNSSYYLWNGSTFVSMSPAGVYDDGRALIYYVLGGGDMGNLWVTGKRVVRPVINLKADTIVSGTGESTDMYVVQ